MTNAGKQIIKRLKEKGKFTLEGNREYWRIIYVEGDKLIDVHGESNGNIETGRGEISEERALESIKYFFQTRARVFNRELKLETDEAVWEYWQQRPYEG